MSETNDQCPMCGGQKTAGTTTFTADLGSGVVMVRRVRATLCSQCGEEWVDNEAAQELERIVADARARRHEVEVTAFA